MIAEMVYLLCGGTSSLCAFLLYQQYRGSRAKLLLWSCFCFIGLALNNVLLFVDMILLADSVDLSVIRTIPAVLGVMCLLYGFIQEST